MKNISPETVEPTDSTTTAAELFEVIMKLQELRASIKENTEKAEILIVEYKNISSQKQDTSQRVR